jgi:putative PIG3 family NAD(P)H quinone oxidoreductase
MKAVVIAGVGGIETFDVRDVPPPAPLGSEVRVRVRAAGINRADLMQARGHYPAPPGAPRDIPGLEFAGEIELLGAGCVSSHKIGDRVFGIVAGGGMAEFVTCHERMAVPIPKNLDFAQAAAVPEAFITAHDALEARAELRPGERILIHAVTGGVGSAAVQIAHVMGCQTFGTSRTADKLAKAGKLGLDVGIDTTREDFAAVVKQATGDQGVHVVVDHIGGPAWDASLDVLTMRGRLVLVGLLGGSEVETDLYTLLRKRLTIVGTTLRARPIEERITATQRFAQSVVPWLVRGLVQPVVDCVFPLSEVRQAQERMKANTGFGKIVLTL